VEEKSQIRHTERACVSSSVPYALPAEPRDALSLFAQGRCFVPGSPSFGAGPKAQTGARFQRWALVADT
jgi:hypothetical protein